jgi:hypothetical protein
MKLNLNFNKKIEIHEIGFLYIYTYIYIYTMNEKPLLTFCFNTEADIWQQDMWNNQLFNRVYDVLAQRTNQVFPIPEPVIDESQLKRIQDEQNQLNANCCNPMGEQYKICGLFYAPIRPDDDSSVKSIYNSHYREVYPPPEPTNIRDVCMETDLFFGLGTPWTKDCLTIDEARQLSGNKKSSNRNLYRTYHSHEVNRSQYPNIDRNMFNNVTKEIYNSIDDRNDF